MDTSYTSSDNYSNESQLSSFFLGECFKNYYYEAYWIAKEKWKLMKVGNNKKNCVLKKGFQLHILKSIFFQ